MDDYKVKIETSLEKRYSVQQLASILNEMYTYAADGMKVAAIHVFGIKYAKIIMSEGYNATDIINASGLRDSYKTEVSKGIKIYQCLKHNLYGITISDA